MVCKEDVLSWFRDLECYKRIDVMYELLNMCVPFELRFLGSCIEEMGKHTYQELRGPTINANDVEKISKETESCQGLLDDNFRPRLLLYLSLLSSRNCSVANWLYKNVLRTDWLEDCIVKGSIKDENVQSEFFLLFVMALHHPAFTFDQKLYFKNILSQLVEINESKMRISPKPSGYGYPPGFGYPTTKSMNTQEVPTVTVPVKMSLTVQSPDETLHQQPSCLPQPQQFIHWGYPGFPCGAPEVPPPFSLPPTVTSLVGSADVTSPSQSRSASPHRMAPMALRPATGAPPPPPPPRLIDGGGIQAPPLVQPQLPPPPPSTNQIDPLSSNIHFMHHAPENLKLVDDDLNSIPEERPIEAWLPALLKDASKQQHQPNGVIRLVPASKPSSRSFVDHFQSLNIDSVDPPTPLQRSNSSSSSSLNQTPPETPHSKPHLNGMPPPTTAAFVPICGGGGDAASPPPPTQFNNCSVPYNYPPFAALQTVQARSMFPFNQAYRPPFTHFSSYQTNDSTFVTCPFPLIPLICSSQQQFTAQAPQQRTTTTPTSCCYNCGALGHSGQECTGQSIEDITQKKTYTIEYSTPLPETGDK